MKKISLILFAFIVTFLIVHSFLVKPNLKPVKGQLKSLDLEGFNKVMIVSHPGDESLWGGSHLLNDNYLIVCVSCGYDKTDEETFLKAINYSNDKAVMLGFSDKIYLNRDLKKIKKQLKVVLNYKNWDEVVIHNPKGEYGNYQHVQLNKIVNELKPNNLYYFGKYYSKKELNKLDKETNIKNIKDKTKMIKLYGLDEYKHMIPFEDWVRGNEWES